MIVAVCLERSQWQQLAGEVNCLKFGPRLNKESLICITAGDGKSHDAYADEKKGYSQSSVSLKVCCTDQT